MSDFEDRAECVLKGMAVEATLRDTLDALGQTSEFVLRLGRLGESRDIDAMENHINDVRNTGESLRDAASASQSCADKFSSDDPRINVPPLPDVLKELESIGEELKAGGPSKDPQTIERYRSRLRKAQGQLYGLYHIVERHEQNRE